MRLSKAQNMTDKLLWSVGQCDSRLVLCICALTFKSSLIKHLSLCLEVSGHKPRECTLFKNIIQKSVKCSLYGFAMLFLYTELSIHLVIFFCKSMSEYSKGSGTSLRKLTIKMKETGPN